MKRLFFFVIICIYFVNIFTQNTAFSFIGKYKVTQYAFINTHIMGAIPIERNINVTINNDAAQNYLFLEMNHDLKMDFLDSSHFSINPQNFLHFDSSNISVEGFGVIKDDMLYMYNHENYDDEYVGEVESICIGTRSDTNIMQFSPKSISSYYNFENSNNINSLSNIFNIIGEYAISNMQIIYRNGEYIAEEKLYYSNLELCPGDTSLLILHSIEEYDFFMKLLDSNYFYLYYPDQFNKIGFGIIKNSFIYLYYNDTSANGYKKSICTGYKTNTTKGKEVHFLNLNSAALYQNAPNPFDDQTEIRYYVPLKAKRACIYVFSLNGNLLLTKPIKGTGSGSITIRGNELQPGMYLYSLNVDGKEVDTKRMILTDK